MIAYSVITFFVAWIILPAETDSSPAESPVYGLKGASVCLRVEGLQHEQIKRIKWKFNSKNILEYTLGALKPEYFKDYEKKTQFNSTDFSVVVKNLSETDQGSYTAVLLNADGEEPEIAKYCLHVQGAVSKPIIQVNNSTLSPVEGFCNVSVNCSVKHSWVYYICDQTQCSQIEPQFWPDVNITVTIYNGNIICTGSNWVSNKTQSEPLGHACMQADSISGPHPSWYIWLILSFVCLCIVCTGCFSIWLIRRCDSTCDNNSEGQSCPQSESTEYSVPRRFNRNHSPSDHQETTLTVYCTLGDVKGPLPQQRTPPPAHSDDTSVYSQVKK